MYFARRPSRGDSCFCVSIEIADTKIGRRVRLNFTTNLHIRDTALLIGIANYFNILDPSIFKDYKKASANLQIRDFSQNVNIIIPFLLIRANFQY